MDGRVAQGIHAGVPEFRVGAPHSGEDRGNSSDIQTGYLSASNADRKHVEEGRFLELQ